MSKGVKVLLDQALETYFEKTRPIFFQLAIVQNNSE